MSVHINQLKKPNLKPIEMKCDKIIDNKLLKYPMSADVFCTNHFTLVLGRMGQGKTSLVVQLLSKIMSECYEHYYIFMPEVSRKSIKNNIFEKLNKDQVFDNLTEKGLETVYEHVEENSDMEENSIIFLDDFQQLYKDPALSLYLEKFIIKIRHLRTTIIMLAQNFSKIPKGLREICQNFIVFDIGKSQLEKLFKETIQMKREKFEDLIKVCFIEPHDWILINLHKSKKIYRNWDEVIL